MHIEVLVEDASGGLLVEILLPKIIGKMGHPHTWHVHPYKGKGSLPTDSGKKPLQTERSLLNLLPSLLRGYGKTPGIDAVVVVVDADRENCIDLLANLKQVSACCNPHQTTLFRIAIEEVEAWYLGDRHAVMEAYPKAKKPILDGYTQDSVCGTWEVLADAVHPGGSQTIKKNGWPLPGQVKCEWARIIGPKLKPEDNKSPSFCKFRDGLRALIALPASK